MWSWLVSREVVLYKIAQYASLNCWQKLSANYFSIGNENLFTNLNKPVYRMQAKWACQEILRVDIMKGVYRLSYRITERLQYRVSSYRTKLVIHCLFRSGVTCENESFRAKRKQDRAWSFIIILFDHIAHLDKFLVTYFSEWISGK